MRCEEVRFPERTMNTDVVRLRKVLEAHEDEARKQPWAKERPWTAKTHVWWENEVAVIDLHDLGAGLARKVVRDAVLEPAERGAIVFVHGRGKHSLAKTQVLRGVLLKELEKVCLEHEHMSFRLAGSGRTVWVSDPKKAPRWAKGEWGPGVWLWMLLLLGAVLAAMVQAWITARS
jgi:hypothetical protein